MTCKREVDHVANVLKAWQTYCLCPESVWENMFQKSSGCEGERVANIVKVCERTCCKGAASERVNKVQISCKCEGEHVANILQAYMEEESTRLQVFQLKLFQLIK